MVGQGVFQTSSYIAVFFHLATLSISGPSAIGQFDLALVFGIGLKERQQSSTIKIIIVLIQKPL